MDTATICFLTPCDRAEAAAFRIGYDLGQSMNYLDDEMKVGFLRLMKVIAEGPQQDAMALLRLMADTACIKYSDRDAAAWVQYHREMRLFLFEDSQ